MRGPLAQLVEQRTFNPWVVGSSPTGPTNQLSPPIWGLSRYTSTLAEATGSMGSHAPVTND